MTERQMQLEDWLDDLCVRFIINLPEDNLSSVERICFQVEEAQWFYEDFIRPLDPSLPSMSLRNFCLRIFTHCPLLSAFAVDGRHMQAFEEFLTYKKRIPVRGAIMLNEAMDSTVLVKGWKKGANWSFPRGKINKDEDDLICAIREVYEETGYDLEVAGLVPEDRQVKYIEVNMREQQMRLYVFRNVPLETYFEPRTRKEISKIQWWRLSELPAFKKKGQHDRPDVPSNANKFYMVAPFLVPLRKWIIEQKRRDAKGTTSSQYLSATQSHDDIMTEEDRGNVSEPRLSHPVSVPVSRSLLEATEALSQLLKIRPATQGLQAEKPGKLQSPGTHSSGQALLALLQSKPSSVKIPTPSSFPPETLPTQQPPSTTFRTLPPLSSFSEPPRSVSSTQGRSLQSNQLPNAVVSGQQPLYASTQSPAPFNTAHLAHTQQLIHPQPLPPHVQQTVFTGRPAHSPLSAEPQLNQPRDTGLPHYEAPNNTQHPRLQAVVGLQSPDQLPPKLTSHSLALLNAFKSRDHATGITFQNEVLPRTRIQESTGYQASDTIPQELPAELLQPTLTASGVRPHSLETQSSQGLVLPRQSISAIQKSTLLNIFKSPTTPTVAPASTASAASLPTTGTLSAVELSAMEPLSSATASTSTTLKDRGHSGANQTDRSTAQPIPDATRRQRDVSILPGERSENHVEKHRHSHQASRHRPAANSVTSAVSADTYIKPAQSVGEHSRPQILKRPQPGSSGEVELLTQLRDPSPSRSNLVQGRPLAVPAYPTLQKQTVPSVSHRQDLLALFGKSSLAVSTHDGKPPVPGSDTFPANSSARSRVGSLASADAASRRGSQTPISSADKGFLLSYLDAVAKGSQR